MKQLKPKKLAACLALVAAVAAAGAGIGRTAAYFTDKKSADATFAFGDVAIVLHEPSFDPGGPPAVPNQEIAKDPIVHSNGGQDCVVFVKVSVPVETFTSIDDGGGKGPEATGPVYWLKDAAAPASNHENSFGDGWILLSTEDKGKTVEYLLGYDEILPPSSTTIANQTDPDQIALLDSMTTPVFGKVQLRNHLEGTLPSRNYHIKVDAYAAQAAGLTDGTSDTLSASDLRSVWDAAFGS